MAEISGQPIVNRSDSVAASYLKAQDYLFNPVSGTAVSLPPVSTLAFTSTGVSGSAGTFTASGHTVLAAASGVGYGPAGYLQIQVSGANVVIPFFTP
jgi:hypothetical protein